jgi:ribosomal protein L7Ae-like RNA K-turn-binding protein
LWVSATRDIVDAAVAKRLFARAARAAATAPPDLADRIERLLAERCRELLGLARRSGQAVAGFEKVREALRGGRVGLLVEASDGAAQGREKLAALGAGVRQVSGLRADELGLAFGRDHVVHAAVAPGRFAERLEIDAGRLAGFRRGSSGVQGTDTHGG